MQLKFWRMQALRSIHESRRFIRRNTWEKQLAHLQAQGHLIYSGSSHLPEIALTFDDGPDPQYTPQILEILQRYQVKATFSVLDIKLQHILMLSGKCLRLDML